MIAIATLIFVFTQLTMAYLSVFVFLPEYEREELVQKKHLLRLGVELQDGVPPTSEFFGGVYQAQSSHYTIELETGIQGIQGVSSGILDAVIVDYLSAEYLHSRKLAIPLASFRY